MKKRIGALCACVLTASMLALTGCGSGPQITVSEFSAEESAVASAMTDVSARFTLPTDATCVIRLTTYQGGAQKSVSEMRNVTAAEGNDALYISGVNSSGLDYTWTITAPGGRLTYPTPYYSVTDGQSMIRITDVGESDISLKDGKEHLLYYVAYKNGEDSSTISEKPFHEWSSREDQSSVLSQFDCVYLVTVVLQTEDMAANGAASQDTASVVSETTSNTSSEASDSSTASSSSTASTSSDTDTASDDTDTDNDTDPDTDDDIDPDAE